ncbi:MAG: dihydrofolate reductase family protein [Candidatus Aminicenantes bacterium]|nr:dihydrofolate reductase family protein [Candidatus Aminicenantes bacterium]
MKVIMHSSISLDGSLLGFEVDMAAHYRIAGSYKADIHLIGSNTAIEGLKLFSVRIPKEQEKDFIKPKRDRKLPLWVIPDTAGKLKGKLHALRRFDLCRDIVILTGNSTPKGYLRYLTERNYDWHYMGNQPFYYSHVLELLAKEYGARTILTDTGKTLNGILLNSGLVDEISLLVHPLIVGKKPFPLFDDVRADVELSLKKSKSLGKGRLWLVYKVIRPGKTGK